MTAPSVLGAARHEALERTTERLYEMGNVEKVERVLREPGQMEAKSSHLYAAMFDALTEIVFDQEIRISELESQLSVASK
jgi:uncharacterized protein YceH (UPF0502 family)